MRTSLYDALGVSPGDSTAAIRRALRALLRRFWSLPRDAAGDVEEALRFVSLASAILTEDRRRDYYDAQLSPSLGGSTWRLATISPPKPLGHERSSAQGEGFWSLPHSSVEVQTTKKLPSVETLAEHFPDHRKQPLGWLGLLALLAVVLAGLAASRLTTVMPGGNAPFWSVVVLLVALAALGGAWIAKPLKLRDLRSNLSDLAVTKWRRDASVFVGLPPPEQDPAWLFRLRVAELTRSNNGYLALAVPGRRMLARAFDYSLLGLALLGILALVDELAPTGPVATLTAWLRSPLLLPSVVVVLGIPLEAWFTARFRTTPGKRLLGLVVVSGVTHVGARTHSVALASARRRAREVALRGLALGFLPLTLVCVWRFWRTLEDDEPSWDALSDTVVLVRSSAWLPAASALLTLAATSAMVLSAWIRSFEAVSLPTLQAHWFTTSVSEEEVRPATTSMPGEPSAAASKTRAATEPQPPDQDETAAKASPARQASGAKREPAADPVLAQVARAQSRRERIELAQAAFAAALRGERDLSMLESICRRWTQDQPGSAEAWRCYGLAQYRNGAGTAALPALRNALRLGARDPELERAILDILRPQ
ncbi:MAG: RDD family protein [Casimicrobiaceae bacterium]|nr:RDD family protein [Casimicrobiaceae bacterium]